MKAYPILIAPTRTGCVATGPTVDVVKQRLATAIEMHLAAMGEDGDEILEPSQLELVEVR